MFIACGETFRARAKSALDCPGNLDSTRMQRYSGNATSSGSRTVAVTSDFSANITRLNR
jgi:hypothetical protein